MKKQIACLIILLLSTSFLFSQTCTDQFIDTGGVDGFYDDNQEVIQTYCPDLPGEQVIRLVFADFNVFRLWTEL